MPLTIFASVRKNMQEKRNGLGRRLVPCAALVFFLSCLGARAATYVHGPTGSPPVYTLDELAAGGTLYNGTIVGTGAGSAAKTGVTVAAGTNVSAGNSTVISLGSGDSVLDQGLIDIRANATVQNTATGCMRVRGRTPSNSRRFTK